MKKIEELLSQRAKSPTPHLQPDSFLATKIAALAEGEGDKIKIKVPNWSFASIVTAFGIIMGIYLGLGIWENGTTQTDEDIVNEFSEAFYQTGFADNINSSLEYGDE